MTMPKIGLGTALAIATMGMVVTVLGVFVASHTVSNTIYVKTVGVGAYWDIGCTNEVSSIDWGYLEPGATMDKTIYVKNEGTVAMTLSMTTGNWNPVSASSYVTVSWNRESHVLNADSVVQAVLTVSLSSGISGITTASFDMTITGTEQT